jgi:hypothetical protein
MVAMTPEAAVATAMTAHQTAIRHDRGIGVTLARRADKTFTAVA